MGGVLAGGGQLWRELQLDRFWADRLPPSRKGTRWDQVLQVLVAYRLIAPGSEWKLHRDWFGNSAMADLLGADFGLAEAQANCTPAMTDCSSTRTRCSRTWSDAGATCSTPELRCAAL